MSDPYGGLRLAVASTVDRVADELRRAIFDGELASGTALREIALAETLGVARSTVREALAALVAEGLAVRAPHRGVAVASPDLGSVRDVCRARAVLELAGVHAWPGSSPEARDGVRAASAAYSRAVDEQAAYQELNRRHLDFHRALVGLLDNRRLSATAAGLGDELRLALAQIERRRRNAHDQADSHGGLLALLEADRVEEAAAAVAHHLAAAERDILDALALPADPGTT